MTLDLEVVRDFLHAHPEDAAPVLEQFTAAEAARVLARVPVQNAARVLERVTAVPASSMLAELEAALAGSIVGELPVDVAARYLRRIPPLQETILLEVPEAKRNALRSLLRYPERSAGALMDPEVLAVAEDLTVREATELVRASADHARYNVYVTDREDRLVGVVNLRELLVADEERSIRSIAHREVMWLPADADPTAIIRHPGWRKVHALPVVDADGAYIGAVRYSTLRRLEEQLLPRPDQGPGTSEALSEVLWVGMGGILDVLAGPRRGVE